GLANILAMPIKNRNYFGSHASEVSMISVLRGGQTLSFTIKFPLEPPPLEPANPDASVARAVRDKLGERFELIEPLYTAGRTSLDSVLQAATEAGEADIAAAANSAERIE